MFGHCLSTKTTPEVIDFDAAGLFGGIINGDRKPGDMELDQRFVWIVSLETVLLNINDLVVLLASLTIKSKIKSPSEQVLM